MSSDGPEIQHMTTIISLVIYMLKLYFDITTPKSFHEMRNL
jgi:hypothetical protein